MTINIIAVVTVFLICQTLDVVTIILSYPSMGIQRVTLTYLTSLSTLLLMCNASVNFIIYTMFYRQFRVVIMRIVFPYTPDNTTPTCV